MAKYVWKRLGEFAARSDDGRDFILIIRGKFPAGGSLPGDPTAETNIIPKRLFTTDKQVVKRIEKGVYKILDTGLIVKSDDPDAP